MAVEALRTEQADLLFANVQAVRSGKVVSSDWFPQVPELLTPPVVQISGEVRRLTLMTIRRLAARQGAHPDGWVVRWILNELGGFWQMGAPSEDYELFTRLLDRAEGVLYRPLTVVSYRMPEADSVSSKFSRLEEWLQIANHARHIRATCRNRWTIRASRAQESWALRQLAQILLSEGRRPVPDRLPSRPC